MELIFNEQSIHPLAIDTPTAAERMYAFIKTYQAANEHGFKGIRYLNAFDEIYLTREMTLNQFCYHRQYRTLGGLLLSLARHPFIDDNSAEEERFIQSNFFLQRGEDKLLVYGLAAAYLYNTLGINFASSAYWKQLAFPLQIEGKEANQVTVLAISSVEHCQKEAFKQWKENSAKVELIECETLPEHKPIHLRDDHGKDILMAFAKRVCNSPYVKGVVNSLPYNSYETEFIRKTTANGLIEMVLIQTDKGLGMVIQTTGRTLRETNEIALLLQETFS